MRNRLQVVNVSSTSVGIVAEANILLHVVGILILFMIALSTS